MTSHVAGFPRCTRRNCRAFLDDHGACPRCSVLCRICHAGGSEDRGDGRGRICGPCRSCRLDKPPSQRERRSPLVLDVIVYCATCAEPFEVPPEVARRRSECRSCAALRAIERDAQLSPTVARAVAVARREAKRAGKKGAAYARALADAREAALRLQQASQPGQEPESGERP